MASRSRMIYFVTYPNDASRTGTAIEWFEFLNDATEFGYTQKKRIEKSTDQHKADDVIIDSLEFRYSIANLVSLLNKRGCIG